MLRFRLSRCVAVLATYLIATPAFGTAMFMGLGDLPGNTSAHFLSGARAVSPDDLVVVGVSESAAGREAFRWTVEEGMVGLGDLPGGAFRSGANGVSANGLVIVGESSSSSDPSDS